MGGYFGGGCKACLSIFYSCHYQDVFGCTFSMQDPFTQKDKLCQAVLTLYVAKKKKKKKKKKNVAALC